MSMRPVNVHGVTASSVCARAAMLLRVLMQFMAAVHLLDQLRVCGVR